MKNKLFSLSLLKAVAIATAVFVSQAQAAAIGPSTYLAANIPLGKETCVFGGKQELFYELINDSDQPETVALSAVKLSAAAVDPKTWEKGYEEIPDISWCRLDKTVVEIPANTTVRACVLVTVPEKAEHYNRRWIFGVACSRHNPNRVPGQGAALSMRFVCRLGIETVSRRETDGIKGGSVGLAPLVMPWEGAIPGEEFKDHFVIQNNTDKDLSFKRVALTEIETDTERQERYYSAGTVPIASGSWIKEVAPFTLKPGEQKKVEVLISVPKDVKPDTVYEEPVLLQSEGGRIDFVRLRVKTVAEKK